MTEAEFLAQLSPLEAYLFKMALAITGNSHDAQDALQEAVLSAYVARDQLRDKQYFKAWIKTIVAHQCGNSRARQSGAHGPGGGVLSGQRPRRPGINLEPGRRTSSIPRPDNNSALCRGLETSRNRRNLGCACGHGKIPAALCAEEIAGANRRKGGREK